VNVSPIADVTLHNIGQLTASGIINGALYALLGVSFALILGVTGRFHFAYAFVFTMSAYVAAALQESVGGPYPLLMIIGLVCAAILGCLIEGFVYRPLARSSGALSLLTIFVASLGITIAGENVIRLTWGSSSKTLNGPTIAGMGILDIDFTSLDAAIVFVSLFLIVGLAVMLRYTRPGRIIKAVRINPEMSLVVGINPRRVYLWVFAIGSILAGVAAMLTAVKYAVVPDMGSRPVVFAFVVAFLGGTRSSPLAVGLAGVFLGLVESLSGLWLSAQWASLVVFAVLFVYLSLRPVELRRVLGLLRPRGPLAPPVAAKA
jgi:branched-chain amino acid transport system permease protein